MGWCCYCTGLHGFFIRGIPLEELKLREQHSSGKLKFSSPQTNAHSALAWSKKTATLYDDDDENVNCLPGCFFFLNTNHTNCTNFARRFACAGPPG